MDFDEAKQLLKEAIDESETSGDILRIWVEKIYQKGKQDCQEDCCGNCEHSIETNIPKLVICQWDDKTRDYDAMICDKYERNLK